MLELMHEWILTLLIATPLVGGLAVGLARSGGDSASEATRARVSALVFSLITLGLSLLALALFMQDTDREGNVLADQGRCTLVKDVSWVNDGGLGDDGAATRYVDFRYHVGVDGLSIWMVILSAGITPLAIWGSFSGIQRRVREYYVLMLLLQAGMLGVFCARDLLLFYIFFEFTLIPLFFIIGIWGGAERRVAAVKFFVYTFAGSVLTFAGVLFLAYQAYVLPNALKGVGVFTFDIETLYALRLPPEVQAWVFVAFAAGFAIKVPLFPFHTWLPLAHTEAPTAGSVLLAGVLLKLGTYGFLRFNLPMLPDATIAYAPIVAVLAVIGIIYGALVAWVQADIKKLVAYSSISHLGFCMLGLFSLKAAGISGAVLYMVNHGLSTGALFLVVGMIYERYHTRRFDELSGLAGPMPWMAFFLVFFTFASIGLPGLNGFVGEFLVLLGTFTSDRGSLSSPAGPLGPTYAVLAATGIVLSAIYMLHMCRRLLFGPLKHPEHTPDTSHGLAPDLTRREVGILASLAVACLVIGVWPNALLDSIRPATEAQVLGHIFDRPTEPGFFEDYAGLPEGRDEEPVAAGGPASVNEVVRDVSAGLNPDGPQVEPADDPPPPAAARLAFEREVRS